MEGEFDRTSVEVSLRFEEEFLSPLAFHTADTKGRAEPVESDGIRTEFQRDRDRILHSKAFRRLMKKTQVFLSPEADHYRTRLTHTLEVTQIARTIARACRLNEDLTEAIALGHDLGHTPFGHAGERVLDRCRQEEGGSFTHYEQSVRVVDVIEPLNLTYEVRNGILCHTNREADTLEGQLVRISDRIAYINHDIDDSCRAGIIEPEEIPAPVRLLLGEYHGERIDSMVRSVIGYFYQNGSIGMDERCAEATEELHRFLFGKVYTNPAAKGQEGKAEGIVEMMYRYFTGNPEAIPEEYGATLRNEGASRAVCDYISGMTDRYALNKFNKLFVPEVWKN